MFKDHNGHKLASMDEAFKLIIEGKIKSTHELYNSMMTRFQVVASDVNHAKEEMLKHQKL
jgi:hypothetical protein